MSFLKPAQGQKKPGSGFADVRSNAEWVEEWEKVARVPRRPFIYFFSCCCTSYYAASFSQCFLLVLLCRMCGYNVCLVRWFSAPNAIALPSMLATNRN